MTGGIEAELDAAVTAVADGAKLRHIGLFLVDTDMQSRALAIIARAVAIVDRLSPIGRDVLIPLLGDATASVQVTAAGVLWQSHRDLALPILRHWQLETGSEVGDTALWLSFSNGGINACGPDPRHDDPAGASMAEPWGVF